MLFVVEAIGLFGRRPKQRGHDERLECDRATATCKMSQLCGMHAYMPSRYDNAPRTMAAQLQCNAQSHRKHSPDVHPRSAQLVRGEIPFFYSVLRSSFGPCCSVVGLWLMGCMQAFLIFTSEVEQFRRVEESTSVPKCRMAETLSSYSSYSNDTIQQRKSSMTTFLMPKTSVFHWHALYSSTNTLSVTFFAASPFPLIA
jgi:hypothetical protein